VLAGLRHRRALLFHRHADRRRVRPAGHPADRHGVGHRLPCAQLLDIAVFNRLRQGNWWKAPLVSTLVSSTVDTAIFFTVAFSAALTLLEPGNDVSWATAPMPLLGLGPEAPFWVSLAIGDWLVKLLLALVALVPFRLVVARLTARVA
jgi:queuosine precursor transporter